MKLLHCVACLTRRGLFRLIWATDGRCAECGETPEIQLTPREIRLCLRNR